MIFTSVKIKYKDAFIIGLRSLSNIYKVNRVNYIVDSVFENPKESNSTLRSRFERLIQNNSAHLTEKKSCDITENEYISAAVKGENNETSSQ